MLNWKLVKRLGVYLSHNQLWASLIAILLAAALTTAVKAIFDTGTHHRVRRPEATGSKQRASISSSHYTKVQPPPARSYLNELQITGEEGGEAEFGVAQIGQTPYRHVVTLPYSATDMFGAETIAFALSAKFTTFRALVGFDPNVVKKRNESMAIKVVSGNETIANTIINPSSPPCIIDATIPSHAGTIELKARPNNYGARINVTFAEPRVFAVSDFPHMPTGVRCRPA